MDILLISATVAAAMLTIYVAMLYGDSQSVDVDVNEGIDPAITDPIDIVELRRDPSKIDKLRGKANLVVYNNEVDTSDHGPVAESWVLDSNGATLTVETTFEGPDSPDFFHDASGSGAAIKHAKNHELVAERNVRIEENARWLAGMLDVPFED